MRMRMWACAAVCCALLILLSGCGQTVYGVQQEETEAPVPCGWQKTGEDTYFYFEDGTMAAGWQNIGDARCYFRGDGTLVTGWLSLDGERFYLDGNGAAVSGVVEVEDAVYLFDENGRLTTGWAEVGGTRYYADANGHPCSGWLELDEGRYFLDENGAAVTGWLESGGCTYYLTEDGSAATGMLEIDGQTHCFAGNGQKLLLVNPWNFLPEDYSVELVSIGGGHRVADYAYEDFAEMMADCKAAGMRPVVRSSYRTMADQQYLYQRRIDRFTAKGYSLEDATEKAGTIVAVPGTSEHQLGLALDIVDSRNRNLDESQAQMPTQQWLMENSWRYGWILRYPENTTESTGIIYEPWHYRYVGREIAADIHESGLCLEDYLEMLTET